ncbi:hypothetical protein GQ53DRAFT_835258 [Thozetella sp. PMI_491]|nr:hypothetical protein GQ53DRAFT_835258 [Thozetella sp. PMI_491]
MARTPFVRTKTGCRTCRTRKIKCDEAKPSCIKCTSSRRTCGGYDPHPQAKYSWATLLGANAIIPNPSSSRTGREGRALEFFQYMAVPNFSYYPDRNFWVELVHAAAEQEPAVRHAVIAIGSLQENLWADRSPATDRFALSHYNKALSHVLTRRDDGSVTLLLCLLFVCIEALRGNAPGAVEHCRHGVTILNSIPLTPWVRDYLLPMFARQSVFPYIFAKTTEDFPLMDQPTHIQAPYTTLEQTLVTLDILSARAFKLARQIGPYRFGPKYHLDYPTEYEREHFHISTLVGQWLLDFADFKKASPPASKEQKCFYSYAEMKALCVRATFASKLTRSEMGYDEAVPTFRRVVDLAEDVIATLTPGATLTSRFSYDLGYLPLLSIVIIRCRNIAVRRAALAAMDRLMIKSEGLWHFTLLRAMCKKTIEVEHGVDLDAYDRGECPGADEYVIPDEKRIREVDFSGAEIRAELNAQNRRAIYLKAMYWYIDNGKPKIVIEWFEMGYTEEVQTLVSYLKTREQ